MILPISDTPNPRGFPAVTYLLIALNVAVYLGITLPLSGRPPDYEDPALREYLQVVRQSAPPGVSLRALVSQVSAYDLVVFKHGYQPGQPRVVDLFTSIFLHGGFMHLFGNMLFLWIYGDNVEHRLGRVRYLLYYLLTGVAATLAFSLFARGSRVPLVGASGAISGVLGFYFLWFPRNKVRLLVLFFPFFMNVVAISARLVLGFYLVIDNLLPFVLSRGGAAGGVAHGAHLGGFLAGLLVAWLEDRREYAPVEATFRDAAQAPARPDTPAAAISRALEAGDMPEAARRYFAVEGEASRRLLAPGQLLALGNWLAGQRHAHAALAVYRRHLRDYPTGPGLAEAHLGAGRVQLEQLDQPAAAYQHFLEAIELATSEAVAREARVGLDQIAQRQKYALRRLSKPGPSR
ncbi:MAG TPA: rhomboid family intramembrane serine protease [Verrucomicrobiota bacterium]|nr:rhomboid family intramembrane serine protease [Verrucomicrobiota bacterium]HNU49748.1 rhomboid family intramembrane serine protease [Verrucomicrobiota bacterium]